MFAAKVDNIGKSAALESTVDASFQLVDAGSPPSFSPKEWHIKDTQSILFPGGYTDFPLGIVTTENALRPFSETEIKRLLDGKAYVALVGLITYSDQFGKHWTRFCFWNGDYAPKWSNFYSNPCVTYGAVGDGDPPKD
jgi:hypothetical protein